MAEINVERKKKSVWGWVIALVIAILVIWALMELLGNDDDTREITPPPAATTPAN